MDKSNYEEGASCPLVIPSWSDVYEMHIIHKDGTVLQTTVEKPFTSDLKTLIGLNIRDILSPRVLEKYQSGLDDVIEKDDRRMFSFTIEGHRMIALMAKCSPSSACIHQAIITKGSDLRRFKRMLIKSAAPPCRIAKSG